MHARFKTARRYLEVTAELGMWWPASTPRWPTTSFDDMKAIAPFVTAEQWWSIEDADWTLEVAWARRQERSDLELDDRAKELALDWAETTRYAKPR